MEVVGHTEQGLALGAEQLALGDGLPKTLDDLADIALEDSQRHQASVQLGVRTVFGMKDVSRFPDFHPEGSPDAELYARLMSLRILEGNVSQVIKGLRQTVTKRTLFGAKRKTLLGVADYFHRNRHRMRYDQYLAQGLPIATGSVEGACKNLIKDRMERSGMRWTKSMAEAIIKLRALYLTGHFNTYWDFHIREDQQRLYPPGRWAVVVK